MLRGSINLGSGFGVGKKELRLGGVRRSCLVLVRNFTFLFSDGNEDVGYTCVLGCDEMGYLVWDKAVMGYWVGFEDCNEMRISAGTSLLMVSWKYIRGW